MAETIGDASPNAYNSEMIWTPDALPNPTSPEAIARHIEWLKAMVAAAEVYERMSADIASDLRYTLHDYALKWGPHRECIVPGCQYYAEPTDNLCAAHLEERQQRLNQEEYDAKRERLGW